MPSSEDTTAIVIYTDTYRIEGRIALVPGARLTDYIRTAEEFVAVTHAVVYDKAGARIVSAEFLDVARAFVQLIAPADLVQQ